MWIKLDDQIAHHPKFLKAGATASWLFVGGLGYSARYLTDGAIPSEALSSLTSIPKPERYAVTLVSVGLWDGTEGGWQIHDYHAFQPSREEVEQRREQRRNSGREGGLRSGDSKRAAKATRKQSATQLATDSLRTRTNPVPDPVVRTPPNPPPGGHVSAIEAAGLITEKALAERAGRFWERWLEVFAELGRGAVYALIPKQQDYRQCLELVGRYADDAHLDVIVRTFLKAKDGAYGERGKTLGWLVRVCPDIDRDLRKLGQHPQAVA